MRQALALLLALQLLSVHSGAINSLKYTGVGGPGNYNLVSQAGPGVWPSCTLAADQKCGTTNVNVGGPLSPFDDELSVVFRGPMNLYRIGVWQPTDSKTWSTVSSWTNGVPKPGNLVFMNNMGGGASGTWSICQGASQSYAAGTMDATVATANNQTFGSFLPPGMGLNIMTATTCDAVPCRGFSRGTSNHGWSGSKMFVIEYNMPADSSSNIPAIWVLNAQVLRSAQYGCNCRGMGGNGGCGEIDLVEVLDSAPVGQAYSEIYSYKGATGTGSNYWINRPYSGRATLIATFDMSTDSITVQQVTSFDWANTYTNAQILARINSTVDQVIPFGTSYYPTSGNSATSPLSNLITPVPLGANNTLQGNRSTGNKLHLVAFLWLLVLSVL